VSLWNFYGEPSIFEMKPARSNAPPSLSGGQPMTAQVDFSSQAYFRNPAAAIEKLRAQGPVVEVNFPIIGRVWATTTQALADQILKDDETFTIRTADGKVTGLRW
jgi:cytochrome P450